ncbi:MAG: GFA family protein [Pseudomonadota bacterium]
MPEITGGCLCGAIRYRVSSAPVNMWNCHCEDCRRSSGASYATNVFVKAADLVVTQGKAQTFDHPADSGNIMTKHFCAACGSQLFNANSGRPQIVVIRAGSLDDPGFVSPRANVYASRALPGALPAGDIPSFDEMPPDPSIFFRA